MDPKISELFCTCCSSYGKFEGVPHGLGNTAPSLSNWFDFMAELKFVYQSRGREHVSKNKVMEEEGIKEVVHKLSFFVPRTPAKPRSKRRSVKKNWSHNSSRRSNAQLELEASSNGVSLVSHAASIEALPTVEEKVDTGIRDDNKDLFDLNKIVLEYDDNSSFVGFAYMDSLHSTSKENLDAKYDNEEVLTSGEEELLHSVVSNNISTSFIPVVKSPCIEKEKLGEPNGDIPVDSMSQSKCGEHQNYIGSSTLPTPSSSKKNLKRSCTNLNNKPRKRPKKTFHKPKVVGFGRPRRLEPKTPKKSTPKPIRKQRISRKKSELDTCSVITRRTDGMTELSHIPIDSRGDNNSAYVPLNDQGILVTHDSHGGFGTLTTYNGTLKKRYAKLSPEECGQALSWKLGIQEKVNETKEKKKHDAEWWRHEREVFHGRIKLLISRMHIIQGDRRFKPWKGSVLDSIVGVFLTQNVSDHLSSSAFMSLAARFPCKTDHEDINMVGSQESVGSNITSIMPVSDDEELLICDAPYLVEDEESSDVKPNDLERASNSLCDSRKHHVLPQISFNENVDDLRISEDNEESYSPRVDQKISKEIEFHTSECCSQVEVEQQSDMKFGETKTTTRKKKNEKAIMQPKTDWNFYRKIHSTGGKRNRNHMDSVNYVAVADAEVDEIADAIKARGQQNIIARRIKDLLNNILEEHGEMDLEWLRKVSPEIVKQYLNEIKGIGLKSVECVRLLALQHVAFPVDVNVGRIAIRLGWVPLQPLPESLQIHLLQEMPVLDNVQKYLWQRLKNLDAKTLYELHYQMITFGKVFCTKRNPDCNSCPMNDQCQHYKSAYASARLALPWIEKKPEPTEKDSSNSHSIVTFEAFNPPPPSFLETNLESKYQINSCEPIIEEPLSPDIGCSEIPDIEDLFLDVPARIPNIRMRKKKFSAASKADIDGFQKTDMSKEIVTSKVSNIPAPKIKDVERLRTKHLVYVLPDDHYILEALDKREHDDPSPYLLVIWTSDETANLSQKGYNSRDSSVLCDSEKTCFANNNLPDTIYGTILIPCRTANRGSFPLNGTYFQVNEVFADHESSIHPLQVSRSSIYNLERRSVYFGTSASTILKGLPWTEKMLNSWKGFIGVRAFDRKTRTPRLLAERLHKSTSGKKRKREEDE